MAHEFENDQALEARREMLTGKITRTFSDEASLIAGSLQHTSMRIIAGAWGIGKTTFLVPQIETILGHRGFQIQKHNAGGYAEASELYIKYQIDPLPRVNNGVIILDEAGVFSRGSDDGNRARIVSKLYTKGYALIPVIAYNPSSNSNAPVKSWQNAEIQSRGVVPEAYDLGQHLLTKELAGEVLRTGLESSIVPIPKIEEIISFVLEHFSYRLRTMHKLSRVGSMDDIRDSIRYACNYWEITGTLSNTAFSGDFTDEQIAFLSEYRKHNVL